MTWLALPIITEKKPFIRKAMSSMATLVDEEK